MTWLGVPVLDWLILAIALGLGIEAWLTTRPTPEERAARDAREAAAASDDPRPGAVSETAAAEATREDRDHPLN